MNTQQPYCRIVPLPDHQVSFQVDGNERTRWHCGPNYPRPCFFPMNGPSGHSLTRMGHPGAPDHDHHRSIWFAHNKVLGINFWADETAARIQQDQWLVYEDGPTRAVMAVRLNWHDGHNPEELLTQELIAILRPAENQETLLELQSTFIPHSDSLEFSQTNFGFLAVRVAKSLSAFFGNGQLTNSDGRKGEPLIFGNAAKWMDYSGPISAAADPHEAIMEGITYFDHPTNPNYPNHWHVREDGWMGCSVCMNSPLTTTKNNPLALRFLLHAHQGPYDGMRARQIATRFADWPEFTVARSTKKHTKFEIVERSA